MSHEDFPFDYRPTPRRGFTNLEAAEFLKKEFPDIPCWTTVSYDDGNLEKIVGKGYQKAGGIGTWKWSRVESCYPTLAYFNGEITKPAESDAWIGVIKVTGSKQEEFMIFSFFSSIGEVGHHYLFSTVDEKLIHRFIEELSQHFSPKEKLTIHVFGGPNISIDPKDDAPIFMADNLRQDIETQVFSFFQNADAYNKLGLRHRRGFLFVGSPGNGKTMFLRHLIRQCHTQWHVYPTMLSITTHTDNDDVHQVFRKAMRHAPALLILEDLDSLTNDCRVARSAFLAELDGLDQKNGVLIIGTTNHPEQVDMALIHRPSRFDRVWHFPLPDQPMRLQYLQSSLPDIEHSALREVAEDTADWSFAYLNELRTTAAIVCINRQGDRLQQDDLFKAHELLSTQFLAGRKHHVISETKPTVGFLAA